MKIRRSPVWVLLAIYYFFSLLTYSTWHYRDKNSVTGDEPHYLVMASGIAKYASFEQTKPYVDEFVEKRIYKIGLAPADAAPTPSNTHAVQGPHGLYNVHNIGLPLLLAAPFALGGVVGAKLFMILISGLAVVLVWKITHSFTADVRTRFLTTLGITTALPLIPAANQIYPDILAGIISLSGLYWFMTARKFRSVTVELCWAICIAYLSWLQIKLAVTSLVLIGGICAAIFYHRRDILRATSILIIFAVTTALLAHYNQYAFGKFSGPYQDGALEFTHTAFMVFLGLLIDQNQGILFQNPLLFAGVLAIGFMLRQQTVYTVLWLLVFSSLLIPNAMHPAWYGGFSFSGRFEWSAIITFFLPAAFGLVALAKNLNSQHFSYVISGSSLLQLYFFCLYTPPAVHLYNRAPFIWLDNYSTFYYPVHGFLPALYNVNWAFEYPPNAAWLLIVVTAVCIGIFCPRITLKTNEQLIKLLAAAIALIFLSGIFFHPGNKIELKASELPSQAGKIYGTDRVAKEAEDSAGFMTYGPYMPLRRGKYSAILTYSSPAPITHNLGNFDIFDASKAVQLANTPLKGTDGLEIEVEVNFTATNWINHHYETRVFWDCSRELTVKKIAVLKQEK